jgi:hypothetical protein
VAAGGRELERASSALLAPHVTQIGMSRRRRRAVLLVGRRVCLAAKVCDGLGEVPYRYRFDAGESRFRRALGRAQDPLESGVSRSLRSNDCAVDRTKPTVERELPDGCMTVEPPSSGRREQGSRRSAFSATRAPRP